MNCCYIYTHKHKLNNYINIYENMLYKSITTLLKFYSNDIDKLYLLIDNMIDEDKLQLIKMNIDKINNNSVNIIYKLIDLNITNIIKYPERNINEFKINRIGLLKFFIPYIVDCDNILYTDIDILYNKNVINDIYKDYDQHKTLFKIYQNGWNSGLILFNCIEWRKNKTLLNDIIEYYQNTQNINYVDNQTFDWLSRTSKYKDICIKDYNWKINHPINTKLLYDIGIINHPLYSNINLNEYNYQNMNILHLYGSCYDKDKYFDEIYNYIMN